MTKDLPTKYQMHITPIRVLLGMQLGKHISYQQTKDTFFTFYYTYIYGHAWYYSISHGITQSHSTLTIVPHTEDKAIIYHVQDRYKSVNLITIKLDHISPLIDLTNYLNITIQGCLKIEYSIRPLFQSQVFSNVMHSLANR